MLIPNKILTRKDEITDSFFKLLDKHIEDILAQRIDKCYHIKDFADLLHIHPTHFSNTISLTTGRSPCDFVEDRLLAEAKRMLSETPLSVAEIGFRLTFEDPTNFTKFFKRFAGKTPRQYRKEIIKTVSATI